MDDFFAWNGDDEQQELQQQELQQSSGEETAQSLLSWEEDVSYEWVVRKIGLVMADVCLVSRGDSEEAYRFVVFHFEEGTSAESLATSLQDFLRDRRDDGLHPDALNLVFHRVLHWCVERFGPLPEDVEAHARALLHQHVLDFAAAQAAPLELGDLEW
ncbi:hypothetical protein B484DRAFT_405190 [Ochromonadaceae sp. CCMP2298]|nr:hypothetical protein B484DRAFT_405190 [Ochromonadaceae sp. CCMP2298]